VSGNLLRRVATTLAARVTAGRGLRSAIVALLAVIVVVLSVAGLVWLMRTG